MYFIMRYNPLFRGIVGHNYVSHGHLGGSNAPKIRVCIHVGLNVAETAQESSI